MYPYLGSASQKLICGKYKDWKFQDNEEDINFYCLLVQAGIIQPDEDTENKIYSHSGISRNENLIYSLLNLYLNGFILSKDRLREIIESSGMDFPSWLINLDDYDYDKFDVNWLSLCSQRLLSEISGRVKKTIGRKLVGAYKSGKINKKLTDIYFDYFA